MPQVLSYATALVFRAIVSIGISKNIALALASGLTSAGVAYGLNRAAGLLSPQPTLPRPSNGKITSKANLAPRVSGFGRARLGGAYMLFAEINGHSYDVLAMHDGLIDAWERTYLHDDEVTLNSGVVQALSDERYGGARVFVFTTRGFSPNTAFSPITAALPAYWTSAHRGDGIATASLECQAAPVEAFSKIYPQGLPQLSLQGRLQLVFDPREGSHVQGDKDTYAWSDNPILHLLAYHTDAAGGMGCDYATRILPEIDNWIAAADVCDELVALNAGGTEKRYRCGGVYTHDADPDAVVQAILRTCDGWIGETGTGALRVFAGQYVAPTISIPAAHVKSYSLQSFTADEEAVNEIRFQYTSPDHQFQEVDGDPWVDEADVLARGRTRSAPLDLTWVQSHTQARRLAKREMKRQNAQRHGVITTDLAGWNALGHRYLTLTIPDLPSLADGFVVEVRKITLDFETLGAAIEWVLADPDVDDWDENTEEGEPPAVPSAIIGASAPSTAPGSPSNVAGTGGVGSATITWTNPTSTNFSYAKVFRAATGAGFNAATAVSGNETGAPGSADSYNNSVAAGTYDYWVVAYSGGGAASSPAGPTTETVT